MNTRSVTDRVQFRTSEEVLAYLRSQGVSPNDLARTLFDAEVRRLRAEDRLARLRGMGVTLPRGADEMVREDREGRDAWQPSSR